MTDVQSFDPPLSGQCLCGAVKITIPAIRPGISVCHCAMCRRWSGGPFFSLHGLKDGAYTLHGADHIRIHESSRWAERGFCGTCGSNLWYRFKPGETHSFMAGLFDLPPEHFAVDEQIFVDGQPAWAELASGSPKKTAAEVVAEAMAEGYDFE